jgi:hypothetical protein
MKDPLIIDQREKEEEEEEGAARENPGNCPPLSPTPDKEERSEGVSSSKEVILEDESGPVNGSTVVLFSDVSLDLADNVSFFLFLSFPFPSFICHGNLQKRLVYTKESHQIKQY